MKYLWETRFFLKFRGFTINKGMTIIVVRRGKFSIKNNLIFIPPKKSLGIFLNIAKYY